MLAKDIIQSLQMEKFKLLKRFMTPLVTTYTFGKQSISSENGPKKVKLEVHVIKQKAVEYIDLLYFAWKHSKKFH